MLRKLRLVQKNGFLIKKRVSYKKKSYMAHVIPGDS